MASMVTTSGVPPSVMTPMFELAAGPFSRRMLLRTGPFFTSSPVVPASRFQFGPPVAFEVVVTFELPSRVSLILIPRIYFNLLRNVARLIADLNIILIFTLIVIQGFKFPINIL
uniref:Uncharacterized protein n=1 Tax=Romanomermis culicivorax TaxID=13658 RepID=A0A915HJN2_ROMCU